MTLVRALTVTVVTATLVSAPLVSTAQATPIKERNVIGTVKWKVPVTVYIPRDPKPGGTIHDEVKRGVDEWKKIAANKNLTVNAVVLDANGHVPGTGMAPDASAKGTIMVNYCTQCGDARPNLTGTPAGTDPSTGEAILKDAEYTTGTMQIGAGAPAQAYVVTLHELGHMLGLEHTTLADSVMQPRIDDYEKLTTPGKSDIKEFDSVYTLGNARLDGSAFAVATGLFNYTYTATWLGGGDIALIDLLVFGAPILNPIAPAGWEVVGFPFGEPINILSFRLAPTDLLEAYLNGDNPVLTFSFMSPNVPTTTQAWAGVDQTAVGPSAIPEPSTLALIAAALTLAARRVVYHHAPSRSIRKGVHG